MLVRFFFLLRAAGVPVSLTELLTLLEALKAGLGDLSAERFYYLARTCLVKDERYYDRYDKAFAAHFKGAEDLFALLQRELPEDWLAKIGGTGVLGCREGRDRSAGRLGEIDADAAPASRGAEGKAPGRQ